MISNLSELYFLVNSKIMIIKNYLAAGFALYMAFFAVIFCYINYSPIPFWDMWGGQVHFLLTLKKENVYFWFSQHNEHRIFLARILFFLDDIYFQMKNYYLIITNIFLVGISIYVFYFYAISISEDRKETIIKPFVLYFIAGLLFLLTQYENLNWGFQSQFFLVQILPLISLYYLAKYVVTSNLRYFVFSLFLLFASEWTMANGILIMPFAVLFTFFYRMKITDIVAIVVVACLVFFTFFYGYHQSPTQGGLLNTVINNKFEIFQYYLIYIGNYGYIIFNFYPFNWIIAYLFGFISLFSIIYLIFKVWTDRTLSPYIGALLFFLLFIHTSALLTACGRFNLGIEQALSSRYTTTSLMGLAATLLIYCSIIPLKREWSKQLSISIFCMSGVVMAVFQTHTVFTAHEPFDQKLAALSLSLDLKDEKVVKSVYPDPGYVYPLSEMLKKENKSFHSEIPYHGLDTKLMSVSKFSEFVNCAGVVEKIETFDVKSNFKRIAGHMNKTLVNTGGFISFADLDQKIVGFGLFQNPSYIETLSDLRGTGTTAFEGYIQVNEKHKGFYLGVGNEFCSIDFPQ